MRDTVLTIGIPCYDNFDGPFFTVQSLRMYHDLRGVEILILDNKGDDTLYRFARNCSDVRVRYIRDTAIQGTCYAKNRLFDLATSPYVMSIDSHVLIYPRMVHHLVSWLSRYGGEDFYHGPLIYDQLQPYHAACRWERTWGVKMLGKWAKDQRQFDSNEPFEIEAMGCGLFVCARSSFPRFSKDMRGFGIEEWYIHEKVRKAGNRVMCLPWLKWLHRFNDTAVYHTDDTERLRNYYIGWCELGWNTDELWPHFPKVNRGIICQSEQKVT